MEKKLEKNSIEQKDLELKEKNHLLAYDLLKTFAKWLDSPDNEVFCLLEYDENSLKVAANASVLAAAILRKAAFDIQLISNIADTNKYEYDMSDALKNLESLANELDSSDDPELVKKASLIDEILITLSSSVDEQEKFKKAMDKKINDIKKRHKDPKPNKVGEKVASIDDTEGNKYRPLQAPLSSRHVPGMAGVMLARISDGLYYNIETGEQIDFNNGYKLNGKTVPGTSVENQTDLENVVIPAQFK